VPVPFFLTGERLGAKERKTVSAAQSSEKIDHVPARVATALSTMEGFPLLVSIYATFNERYPGIYFVALGAWVDFGGTWNVRRGGGARVTNHRCSHRHGRRHRWRYELGSSSGRIDIEEKVGLGVEWIGQFRNDHAWTVKGGIEVTLRDTIQV
jgi:hypothetical protein